jgi:membrane protease subunit HflK
MQEILSKTPSIVLDDKLQGIVPYLPLDGGRAAPAPAAVAAPPQPARPGSSP